ncbi:MAG TPA: hypothetical protein VK994_00790 [Bacteroidales bacterium]|nr:hypothetical protein [Bacteroidales bacterium]
MSKILHRLYLLLLSAATVAVLVWLIYQGHSYYNEILEERYFHPDHQSLKPSGILGHGFGIIGSLLILIGVTSYMVRKRSRKLSRLGAVKHWLEFHIFLCTVGPILILFHTSLKFGGIVAISFWSMVAVFLSGIIGRFIYIQIPRSIEGRELSLAEVREMKMNIDEILGGSAGLNENTTREIRSAIDEIARPAENPRIFRGLSGYFADLRKIRLIRTLLRKEKISRNEQKKIVGLIKKDISLSRKIARMSIMQNLFRYWHVAHLPFAFVMLIIMLIHVGVTIVFGYRWIF